MLAKKFSISMILYLTLFCIIVVSFLFSHRLLKEVSAANTMTCSSTPYVVDPGEEVTISAVINFTPADVWAVIENEDGVADSHYSLDEDDATHYSKVYTTSGTANGRYDIGIFATVDGTGEQVFCNPSTGAAWIKKSLSDINWTGRLRHKVVINNGKLWILGGFDYDYQSDVWSSADGQKWIQVTKEAPWGIRRSDFGALALNNKIFVFGGYKLNSNWTVATLQNDVWSSADGAHWTRINAGADWSARSSFGYTVYNNELWLAGGCTSLNPSTLGCASASDEVWSSSDGIDWTLATNNPGWSERSLSKLLVHNDGNDDRLFLIGGVDYPGGTANNVKDVWSSADGADWAEKTAAADFEARYLFDAFSYDFGDGQKIWLMGGREMDAGITQHNDIWSSVDGADWDLEKDDVAIPGIGVQPSKWTHWTPRRFFQTVIFNAGNGPKAWLLGGYDKIVNRNDIWTTTNGVDWTLTNEFVEPEFGSRFDTPVAVYNNKLWLVAGLAKGKGLGRDVWSSADGISWTCEFGSYTAGTEGVDCNHATPGWVARFDDKLLVYDDGDSEKLFMIGGCTWPGPGYGSCPSGYGLKDVWSYDDNVPEINKIWIQETAAAAWDVRNLPALAVYDNKMWLMGGLKQATTLLQDVWYSSDGTTWTQASNAPWSVRTGHSAVVYDDKLWVMGGQTTGPTRLNDVWYSTDPINSGWTQATSSAAWSPRLTFGLLNFNNRMWVVSGQQDGTTFAEYLGTQDIYWSQDGAIWNLATDTADFAGRDFFSSTVFQDRIWLTGGDSNAGNNNDVWASRYADLNYYVMTPLDWKVNIRAQVDPTLSLVLSSNACELGVLTADAIQTCGYSVAVATNAQSGYTGYIRQNHGFESTIGLTNHEIHSENGTPLQIEATGTLVGENGEYGVGILTADTTDWPEFTGDCADYDNQSSTSLPAKAVDWSTAADPDAYLGDNVDNVFATSSDPVQGVDNGLTYFCHGVRIKWDTPPGSYSQTVTISVVANF